MKSRLFKQPALWVSCLGFLAFPWACAQTKTRGEIMLAISADMSIPKNMNQVTVEVLDAKGQKVLATYPLRPEDLGQPMPGSLAIVPPDGGGELVRIRLRAEHDDASGGEPTVRVVREAVVAIPSGRTAMLTMPLRWLCDGKVKKTDDGSYTSDCGTDETCAAGICVSAKVDADKLPDYDPTKIFGGGDENGNGGTCMDVVGCFEDGGADVVPDANCTLPLPAGISQDSVNFAMVTGSDGDGICPTSDGTTHPVASADAGVPVSGNPGGMKTGGGGVDGVGGSSAAAGGSSAGAGGPNTGAGGTQGVPLDTCYVPLDRDPIDGWHVDGDRIAFPAGVCQRLTDGKIRGVRVTTACKTKDFTTPICGSWTNVGAQAPVGATMGGNVGMGPNGQGGSSATCQAQLAAAQAIVPTIGLLVDQSSDMSFNDSTWRNVKSGIDTFAARPEAANIFVSVQLTGAACGAPTMIVPGAPLSGVLSTIDAALTSTQPAATDVLDFSVGLLHAYDLASSSPSRSDNAVVLMAAGQSASCGVTSPDSNLMKVVSTAAAQGTKTFVLAFPSDPAKDTSDLDAIATAGLTTRVNIDASGGDVQVADVLSQIATSGACTYLMAPSASLVAIAGGAPQTFLTQVSGAQACTDTGGYYLGQNGAFTLCPTSCAAVTDKVNGVLYGFPCGGPGGSVLPPPGTGGGVNAGGTTGFGGVPNGGQGNVGQGGQGKGGTVGSGTPCASDGQCPPETPTCCLAQQVCGSLINQICRPGVTNTGTGGVSGGGGAGGFVVDPAGNATRAPGFVDLSPPPGAPISPAGDTGMTPPTGWLWHSITGSICRDGTAGGLYIHRSTSGKSNDVVIYLEGGGACSNNGFCNFNPANLGHSLQGDGDTIVSGGTAAKNQQPGVYSSDTPNGLFDTTQATNPFADWNMVYIPNCTGDLFFGANPGASVPPVLTNQQFVGYANMKAFMARLAPTFAQAAHVALVGANTGGLGALLNASLVQDCFPNAPVTVISDSGPLLDSVIIPSCLDTIWRKTWNLDASMPPDCPNCQTGNPLNSIIDFTLKKHPSMKLGIISTTQDAVMRTLFSQGTNNCSNFQNADPISLYGDGGGALPLLGTDYADALTRMQAVNYDPSRVATYYMDGNSPNNTLSQHVFRSRFYTQGGANPNAAFPTVASFVQDLVNGLVENVGPGLPP